MHYTLPMLRNLLWLAAFSGASLSAQTFCDQVTALTRDPTVAADHWGVSVTALDGTPLCAVNDAQLFRPASNAKLFTMAAALALLGPDRRFATQVVADGSLADGILHGNLKLAGAGDANFGAHDLPFVPPALRPRTPVPEPATLADIEALADQVYARGVRQITGDVVGDDEYFAWEPYPVGWGIDDLTPGYGAPVSALTIHDNELELDIAPDAARPGASAVATFLPAPAYYVLANTAKTSAAMKEPHAELQVSRQVGSRTVEVAGSIPLNAGVAREHLAIQDPAAYAALALKEALERRGVKIDGAATAHHAPSVRVAERGGQPEKEAAIRQFLASPNPAASFERSCSGSAASETGPPQTPLGSVQSPRLSEDILYTAKESQNLHAELMLRNLGALWAPPCANPVPAAAGLGVVRAYLVQAGIASPDFVLYDGSGLSGHDLVAPRALTELLVYAAKQKWFETFRSALPIGGVDGTLASRFLAPGSTLAGKVWAKTGTLGESRALSGYVIAASGKTVVFSVMVDNHPPSGGADRIAMDRIVEAIAAGN